MKISITELLTIRTERNTDIVRYVTTLNPKESRNVQCHNFFLSILMLDDTMNNALKDTEFIKSKRQPSYLKRILTKANFTSSIVSN